MYDAEDDPDRLYFSRGLGRLEDSDDESLDEGSAGLGDTVEDWGEEEVSLKLYGRMHMELIGGSTLGIIPPGRL